MKNGARPTGLLGTLSRPASEVSGSRSSSPGGGGHSSASHGRRRLLQGVPPWARRPRSIQLSRNTSPDPVQVEPGAEALYLYIRMKGPARPRRRVGTQKRRDALLTPPSAWSMLWLLEYPGRETTTLPAVQARGFRRASGITDVEALQRAVGNSADGPEVS